MKKILLPALAIIATLLMLNFGVYRHEQLLEKGAVVYLPLAPVDPRSLMQGDFMALDYAVVRDVDQAIGQHSTLDWPERGWLTVLLKLDSRRIATATWVGVKPRPAGASEQFLQVKALPGYGLSRVQLPSHAYFFAEGDAERYSRARYAILRVSKEGRSLLAGLADEHLKPL